MQQHAEVAGNVHLCVNGISADSDTACVAWLTTALRKNHCVFQDHLPFTAL